MKTMMISQSAAANPLDLAEELVAGHNWTFQRFDEDELVAEIQGRWSDYQLYFLWRREIGTLYFSLSFEGKIKPSQRAEAYELIGRVNEKLWLGHFDLLPDDGSLLFRHTMLLRGMGGFSIEQLEDLVDCAVTETEKFYPAFQYFIWGGKSPKDAMEMALFETIGEA